MLCMSYMYFVLCTHFSHIPPACGLRRVSNKSCVLFCSAGGMANRGVSSVYLNAFVDMQCIFLNITHYIKYLKGLDSTVAKRGSVFLGLMSSAGAI